MAPHVSLLAAREYRHWTLTFGGASRNQLAAACLAVCAALGAWRSPCTAEHADPAHEPNRCRGSRIGGALRVCRLDGRHLTDSSTVLAVLGSLLLASYVLLGVGQGGHARETAKELALLPFVVGSRVIAEAARRMSERPSGIRDKTHAGVARRRAGVPVLAVLFPLLVAPIRCSMPGAPPRSRFSGGSSRSATSHVPVLLDRCIVSEPADWPSGYEGSQRCAPVEVAQDRSEARAILGRR